MPTVNKSPLFFKVIKSDLRYGFAEAVFLAYVREFQANGLRCFVSRAKISADLPISESGARYMIQRLVKLGALSVAYEGRKRFLTIPAKGAKSAPRGGTIKPIKGAQLNQIRGHEKANTKIYHKDLLKRSNYKEAAQNTDQDWLFVETGVAFDDLPD